MAAREIRAAPRRLLLLTASVAIGVAALVAIDSFTDNLRDSVRDQARALLGADLELTQPAAAHAGRGAGARLAARTRRRGGAPDQLLGHGLRAAHQRHAAGAGGGGRAGLSVLRRDPHRPRAPPGRAAAGPPRGGGPVAAQRAQRTRGRHPRARRGAVHHHRRGDQRTQQRRRPHGVRPADLHPLARSPGHPAARLRRPGGVRGVRPPAGRRLAGGHGPAVPAGRWPRSGSGSAPSPTTSAT